MFTNHASVRQVEVEGAKIFNLSRDIFLYLTCAQDRQQKKYHREHFIFTPSDSSRLALFFPLIIAWTEKYKISRKNAPIFNFATSSVNEIVFLTKNKLKIIC